MKIFKYIIFFTFFCILAAADISAAPGDLDPTFGKVGFDTKSFTGQDRASTILLQTDGKFLVVGSDSFSFAPIITLVRYNANGSLDASFGSGGVVQVRSGHAFDAKLQADGKIVVVGTFVKGGNSLFAVSRFNSNGSLDTSFAGDGIFTDTTAGVANAAAIQPDGKIIAVGTGRDAFFRLNYSIIRLNTNGTLDTTFDGDGKILKAVRATTPGGEDKGNAVAVQTDGKILVGGESRFFTILRFNADGSLDTSFGLNGIAQADFTVDIPEASALNALTIDGSGKIVAAGVARENQNLQGFAFARFNPDGSLDTSFSDDGKFITTLGIQILDVKIQSDGKIIGAGAGSGDSNITFTLVRLDPNGVLDKSFGKDGKVTTQIFDGGSASIENLALGGDGTIFAGGYAGKGGSADEDFAFAKYNPNGTPSATLGIFGYDTQNILDLPNRPSEAFASATQTDGKIIVVGSQELNQDESYGVIIRYTANGRIDKSFSSSSTNGTGFVTIHPPNATTVEVSDVVIQPDGKILAVGSYEGDTDAGIFIVRLNANGEIDFPYGGKNNGFAVLSVFSGGGLGRSIKLLPDGKILVAGASANIAAQLLKFAVFKFNADGSLDTSFGSNGIALANFSSSNDVALSLDVQTDGKIVASGASRFDLGSNGSLAIARFNPNGSADNSFGTGGKVTSDVGNFIDLAADVKLQNDGKIVIGGVSCTNGDCLGGNGFIFRYNSNGSPDSTFNGNGRAFVPASAQGLSTGISSIAIQKDGKILGGGVIENPLTSEDALLIRYNSDGSPDANFGTNGIVSSDIGKTKQLSNSIDLQTDGKIVSVGSSENGSRTDFAIWRYLGDGEAVQSNRRTPFDFDGDGKADISVFRPNNGVWYLLNSQNGFTATQFGISTDKPAPADYDGDGKTDIAAYRSGVWYLLRSTQGFTAVRFGSAGDIPQPADFDGDGQAELAVFRPSTGVWYVLNLKSNQFTAVQFGISTDKPVVGDYDGDGKADYAVFRPLSGTWYYLQSRDGFGAIQFGLSADQPIPADYDGDGKTDLAVYRPSNGVWYLQKSQAGFTSVQFGNSTDQPTPADYDGDGKADIAVFRSGTWYLQQTKAGSFIVQFGEAADKAIPSVFVQ